jgi:2-polyprenyl-3-methyl-5-hydroxy-6-metoxy-1,4-benzoquinol methylase
VGEFRVVRCRACGLFYTNPRRSVDETAALYSKDYFTSENPSTLGYDDYSIHEKGLKEVFSEHLSVVEKYVRPPASIIDVGCAFGYFVQVAQSRGWTAEGIEISAYASQIARENTKSPIYTGTLSQVKLKQSYYDVATMWDVLEHAHNPTEELTQANRIMKPDGYLFMTVPNAGSVPARLMRRHWYGFKSAAEHNYFFTKDTLTRLLAKTGFTLVESRRGVWPCTLQFLTSKLVPYSPSIARMAARAFRMLRIEEVMIKFRFIDMFVVAQKRRNTSQESPGLEQEDAKIGAP